MSRSRVTILSLRTDPSDPEGNLDGLDIVYGYDDDGNLTSVMHEDADGNVISQQMYAYTPGTDAPAHNMVSYTDPNGNTTTYAYDTDDTQKPDLDGAATPTPGLLPYFQVPGYERILTVTQPGGVSDSLPSITTFTYNFGSNTRVVSEPSGLGFRPPPTR